MSQSMALDQRARLPLLRRLLPLLAVGAARPLARLKPARLRAVLEFARRGAAPADAGQAQRARDQVVAVSLRCAGQNCLQRSLATALLCRARGVWPTWCTGVRTHPFAAHAWVEAEGRLIGEPHPEGYYKPLLTVPPRTGACAGDR
ncbi:transglutaminase superfamily protein [Streptomyces sp. 2333.5]|uniref:lasso peptide biosynthesis B2 protein n=1 Tax=unclassified Streptomyces TaxID=2593676 RepID=UPI00089DA580|nr:MULTISPECIES: lasso peptide biosynthesis B2 protein [unclassified Streptomyces]PJJ03408.1 transglutaminase superfamily protein [Streptomyces sp. 2333.5]SED43901.1 Transglutaminase-like superfamily protein [Streptomyces sp. 2314.4]SEE44310.1 Transglutaminase-like superfamily protein [Streptomyces sp. 2112.2]